MSEYPFDEDDELDDIDEAELEYAKKMLENLALFQCVNGILPDKPYESVADLIQREPGLIKATLPKGMTLDMLKKHLEIDN